MLVLIFKSYVLQCWMFMLKVTDMSNNDITIRKSHLREQKTQASDSSEHSVSNIFFLFAARADVSS